MKQKQREWNSSSRGRIEKNICFIYFYFCIAVPEKKTSQLLFYSLSPLVKIMDVFRAILSVCAWITLQIPAMFNRNFHSQDFFLSQDSRGNSIHGRYFSTENLMMKIIATAMEENKYSVRDIYFISGIIYDFPL